MESLIPVAGPPVFLVPPGGLTASVVTLTGPEGHHAAAVRRLRAGERADVSDGAGTLAEGVVTAAGRTPSRSTSAAVRTVRRRNRASPSRRPSRRATGANSRWSS